MAAMFEFAGGGLSVYPYGSDTVVSFELFNVGDEEGQYEVGCEVDNNYVTAWSGTLAPQVGDQPQVNLGYVEPGVHNFLVYVNPGSGQNDHLTADQQV